MSGACSSCGNADCTCRDDWTPTMPDSPRPVWLTREQRIALYQMFCYFGGHELRQVVDAWDAAPSDPMQAAIEAMLPIQHHTYDYDEEAVVVLKALGMPDE